jgi:nitrite reductase (NADH) small subunit
VIRVCSTEDVPPGEGRAITVHGRRVAIFRTHELWYALDAYCPHLGGPLADGILADRTVICPLHERRFALDTGEAITGGACVQAHEVEIRNGEVYLQLAAERAAAA